MGLRLNTNLASLHAHRALEERTGLSDVGNYERGERNPTLVTLSRLAKALDVSAKDLVDIAGGSDEEEEEIRAQVLDLLAGCDAATRRKAAEMLRVFLR